MEIEPETRSESDEDYWKSLPLAPFGGGDDVSNVGNQPTSSDDASSMNKFEESMQDYYGVYNAVKIKILLVVNI